MCPGHHILTVQGRAPHSHALGLVSVTWVNIAGLVGGQPVLLASSLLLPKRCIDEMIHLLHDEFDYHNVVTIKQV